MFAHQHTVSAHLCREIAMPLRHFIRSIFVAGLSFILLTAAPSDLRADGVSDFHAARNAKGSGDLARAVELFSSAIESGDLSQPSMLVNAHTGRGEAIINLAPQFQGTLSPGIPRASGYTSTWAGVLTIVMCSGTTRKAPSREVRWSLTRLLAIHCFAARSSVTLCYRQCPRQRQAIVHAGY